MHLDIDGSSVVRRPAVRHHVESEIARQLSRFADRISAIRIRLRERAPSEPTRAMCGIALALDAREGAPGTWVLGRAEDDDATRAVDRALERVARTVSEEIARADEERARRARSLLAFSQTGIVERV